MRHKCDHPDCRGHDEDDGGADPYSGISTFFHCSSCMAELPQGVSPREWNRTETGVTPEGQLRVWCIRHNQLVVDLPLEPGERAGARPSRFWH